MTGRVHITLTINLKDGGEIVDIEGSATDMASVSAAVSQMIADHGVKDGEWSSLVVVVVPC